MSHQQTVELIHRLESISDEVDLYINGESVKNLIYTFVTSLCLSLGSTVYSQIPVPPAPRPVPAWCLQWTNNLPSAAAATSPDARKRHGDAAMRWFAVPSKGNGSG